MRHIPARLMLRIPQMLRVPLQWSLAAALSPLVALPAVAADAPPPELSLAYSYVRANAPPDHCDCFSMNGGSGALLWNLSDTIGVVGDLGVEHASNVRETGLGLTLTSIHGGVRYTDRHLDGGFVSVFGQALIGATRSSGGLAAIARSGGGASTDFSALLGAGIDLNLNPHFSIRALELDYFLTTLPNGVNDYQNNLRASVGVVFRFGAGP